MEETAALLAGYNSACDVTHMCRWKKDAPLSYTSTHTSGNVSGNGATHSLRCCYEAWHVGLMERLRMQCNR